MSKNYCCLIVDRVVTQIIVSDYEWATTNLEGSWYDLGSEIGKVGVGYSYNEVADVFVAPQPFPSWSLDENYDWQAPIDCPADGKDYSWDEANQVWVESPAI
jgi:hypothetical protein